VVLVEVLVVESFTMLSLLTSCLVGDEVALDSGSWPSCWRIWMSASSSTSERPVSSPPLEGTTCTLRFG
jgi:hypothetical protein